MVGLWFSGSSSELGVFFRHGRQDPKAIWTVSDQENGLAMDGMMVE